MTDTMRYCVSLTEENLHLIDVMASTPAIGFEIRLDRFTGQPDFKQIRARTLRPLLATYRTQAHGGIGDAAVRDQQGWLLRERALAAGFDMVDVELDESDRREKLAAIRRAGAVSILSHHAHDTAADLDEPLAQALACDADIVKIIGSGDSPAALDAQQRRYKRWSAQQGRGLVHFYMGGDLTASRVLSLAYGAPFTFAASSPDRSVAPGQLAIRDFTDVFKITAVALDPLILFAVIGQPIGHSASPAFHNPRLKAETPQSLFLPMPAASLADLDELLRVFPNLVGFAITKPMKERACDRVDHYVDQATQALGAINTLVRLQDGWHGANTDMLAMQRILREDDPGGTVRVLGYGGLGKAVVCACRALGRPVEVTNRSPERLQGVPEDVTVIDWGARHRNGPAVLVNATSLGMAPRIDTCPVNLIPESVNLVIETVYNPRDTAFLAMARAAEADTLDGTVLFERQAAIQQRFFQRALRHAIDAAPDHTNV